MPINMISMLVGFTVAELNGVSRPDAVTFGAVSSFLPPTPISLIVIDQMAKRRAAELAPPATPQTVKVIDVVNQAPNEAAVHLRDTGLTPEFKFQSDVVVVNQSPPAGNEVDAGSTVTLEVDHQLQ